MLRGESASAKSLHSIVQSLESDKAKLELQVKNLELQLKENRRQLGSSSGKVMATWCFFPVLPLPAEKLFLVRCPWKAAVMLHLTQPICLGLSHH